MPSLPAHLLHLPQGVVEVAGDLHRQRAVFERLRQLAVADLAAADEDDRPHQLRRGAVDGEAGAGVAGARARGPACADHAGVRERRRHAVVLEAARRVHPLVLQEQRCRASCPTYAATASARWQSVWPSPMVRILSSGANGNSSRNRQTPEKSSGSVRFGPLALEVRERLRHRQPVPVVGHVEQPAALRAAKRGVGQVDGRPAGGVDAALEGEVGHAGCCSGCAGPIHPNRRPLNGTRPVRIRPTCGTLPLISNPRPSSREPHGDPPALAHRRAQHPDRQADPALRPARGVRRPAQLEEGVAAALRAWRR